MAFLVDCTPQVTVGGFKYQAQHWVNEQSREESGSGGKFGNFPVRYFTKFFRLP